MGPTRTKRWALGGAAVGLAAALSAGVAFAVSPGAGAGGAAAARVTSAPTSSGDAGSWGYTGDGAMMGGAFGGNGANGAVGGMTGGTTAMMGGPAGGSSMTGGGDTISAGGLSSLVARGEQAATVDTAANTVTYAGRSVSLVALASPHGKPARTTVP